MQTMMMPGMWLITLHIDAIMTPCMWAWNSPFWCFLLISILMQGWYHACSVGAEHSAATLGCLSLHLVRPQCHTMFYFPRAKTRFFAARASDIGRFVHKLEGRANSTIIFNQSCSVRQALTRVCCDLSTLGLHFATIIFQKHVNQKSKQQTSIRKIIQNQTQQSESYRISQNPVESYIRIRISHSQNHTSEYYMHQNHTSESWPLVPAQITCYSLRCWGTTVPRAIVQEGADDWIQLRSGLVIDQPLFAVFLNWFDFEFCLNSCGPKPLTIDAIEIEFE